MSLNSAKNNPKIITKITAVRPRGGLAQGPPKYATVSADMMANLAQSPCVVEASTGDLVDVVLHGQLAVHCPGRHVVPDDNVTLDYRPTDLN